MSGWEYDFRPAPLVPHVYRDADPLGRGRWFWYISANGHVIHSGEEEFTEEEAIARSSEFAGKRNSERAMA